MIYGSATTSTPSFSFFQKVMIRYWARLLIHMYLAFESVNKRLRNEIISVPLVNHFWLFWTYAACWSSIVTASMKSWHSQERGLAEITWRIHPIKIQKSPIMELGVSVFPKQAPNKMPFVCYLLQWWSILSRLFPVSFFHFKKLLLLQFPLPM